MNCELKHVDSKMNSLLLPPSSQIPKIIKTLIVIEGIQTRCYQVSSNITCYA